MSNEKRPALVRRHLCQLEPWPSKRYMHASVSVNDRAAGVNMGRRARAYRCRQGLWCGHVQHVDRGVIVCVGASVSVNDGARGRYEHVHVRAGRGLIVRVGDSVSVNDGASARINRI